MIDLRGETGAIMFFLFDVTRCHVEFKLLKEKQTIKKCID